MINRIYFNGIMILNKKRIGQCVEYYMEDGSIVKASIINSGKIEIQCHECGKLFSRRLYGGKNGLLNRKYICFSCNSIGEKNPFFGKKHSAQFKEKLSTKRKGKWFLGEKNAMFGVNVWNSYSTERKKEVTEKLKEACAGKKNGFYGKKHSLETRNILSQKTKLFYINHPERIEEHRQRIMSHKVKYHKNTIEKAVEDYLLKNKVKYKYNKILYRRYQYDFIIGEDILLEVQGDYWHGNPIKYGEEIGKKKLNERQKFKKERDILKKLFAEEYGYKIFYIWEKDIRDENFNEVDKILKYINERENNESYKV